MPRLICGIAVGRYLGGEFMAYRERGFAAAARAVKERLNIVDVVGRYVRLRPAGGGRMMAPCPFHQETKPSFSVQAEQGFFYCFGCQASGDIFDFYAKINGVEFKEALEQLAQEAGVRLEQGFNRDPAAEGKRRGREAAFKLHELARAHFRDNLAGAAGKTCRVYMEGRGLDKDMAASFELGWSLEGWNNLSNVLIRAGYSKEQGVEAGLLGKSDRGSGYDFFRSRLMFPIKDTGGRVIAFGGRDISGRDERKYINSPASPIYKKADNLYGLFQARAAISKEKFVFVTEGYMDVLALHQFGYRNACGVLSADLTPEQLRRLSLLCSRLELIFDGDTAGRKAALHGAEMALARGVNCLVISLPQGGPKDIDEFLKQHGREAFEELRSASPDALTYCMRVLNADFSPRESSAWVREFLHKVEQPEFVPRYVSALARGLGLEERLLRQEAGLLVKPEGRRSAQALPRGGGPGAEAALDREFIARAVRYPRFIPVLRDKGLGFVLQSGWGKSLWSKLLGFYADAQDTADFLDKLLSLDEDDKSFCLARRADMPPSDPDKEEAECAELCRKIGSVLRDQALDSQARALSAAQGDAQDALLRALLEKALETREIYATGEKVGHSHE